ncbi:putative bifunctional diguanylate cyclase/phosphodiesterase [Planctomonas psychrotolerans]|uniref:putative bifunctional diguanylate cyclase/phosphodiesterase n=1 Tax=Planctomonas psychrotolerans TaxID=2528712 RepID=UPI0012388D0B|nr:bifunctional diguanylate cyclase/phosphodiesterase [Planctomonas psychrotolerans]
MDNNEPMAGVLADFARSMTDLPPHAIVDMLLDRVVELLPVTSAAVTLNARSDPALARSVSATDAPARRLAELQNESGQGPAAMVIETGGAVHAPDLAEDQMFGEFGVAAAAEGVAAVFSFPLGHRSEWLGTIDLFRDTPGPLEPWATSAAKTLADVTSAYLVNARERETYREGDELFRTSSLHDALTGLPNRVLLLQRIEHAGQRSRRSNAQAAVLLVDLDGFRFVNDKYGHWAGDALLVAVAHRIRPLLRPGDTLSRMSGDQFVILCEDVGDADVVHRIAERVLGAFSEPFRVTSPVRAEPVQIPVTAAVGIAFTGSADSVGSQLIADADFAMYQAKRSRVGSQVVLDLRGAIRDADRAELQQDLRTAVQKNALTLAYQPIVCVADGTVTGVEALLRWRHPDRGPMPAPLAVALAEESSLIHDLGDWVLRRSIFDRAGWLLEAPERRLDLAVNISTRQLLSPGFPARLEETLRRAGADPGALTLEVSEGIFLEDSEYARSVLSRLKRIGVRLALDDFGTGTSSPGYLRDYPVDVVKIDTEIIAEIDEAPVGGAIISAVTELAHIRGISVTVEGVETARQREAIARMGCDSAQGYLYSRPMSAGDFADLLRESHADTLRLPLNTA